MGTAERLLLVLSVVALWGCAAPDQVQKSKLLDRLEAKVRLPEGARALQGYARHYAPRPDGTIAAVYNAGSWWPDPEWKCETLTEDFRSQPSACPPVRQPMTFAGQRRWYEDEADLPLNMDGGCGVVDLLFDPKTGRTLYAECHGEA